MTGSERPDISVILLTYNHEAFIERAIESVLSQQVDAEVEVLISEDHSTDQTRHIVTEYARRYPDRIRLLLSEQNRNDGEVYARAFRAARGEFIAYLDGDDFWKPGKLAAQLALMRERPEVALCYHDVEIIVDPAQPSGRTYAYGPYRGFVNLLLSNCIASGSTLFRKEVLGELPSWFHDVTFGDWALAVMLADRGEVAYIDRALSGYRDHAGGLYSGASARQRQRWAVDFAQTMYTHVGGRRHLPSRLALASARYRLARTCADEGDRPAAIREALRSLALLPSHATLPASVRLRLLGSSIWPRGFEVARRLRHPRLRRSRQREPSQETGLQVRFGHAFGDDNPYIPLLEAALKNEGITTGALRRSRELLRDQIDVWHLHWPEAVARRSGPSRALSDTLRLVAELILARARGVAIVWTVHNVQGHGAPRPRVDRFVRWSVSTAAHAWISLSKEAAAEAAEAMPRLRSTPRYVIAHGHYRTAYPQPPSRQEARERLGLPQDTSVLLHFGLIRSYKNVPALIEVFRAANESGSHLVVAGRADRAEAARIRAAANGDQRIDLRLGFVEDQDVPMLFAAADLVVLPFRRILNSGSAILALSFDRPILVPDQGSMQSLAREVGAPWVTTYDGSFGVAALQAGIAASRSCVGTAPIGHLDWDVIGCQTEAVYRAAVVAARGRAGQRASARSRKP